MFAKKTRSVLKCLGAEKEFLYNENINEKIELLTLVKITKLPLAATIKYTFLDLTILDLWEGAAAETDPAALVSRDIVVLENVTTSTKRITDNSVKPLNVIPGSSNAEVAGKVTTEDSASSFTVKKDMVDLRKLRQICSRKKINTTLSEIVTKPKTEKLAFVDQVFYNGSTVTLHSKAHGRSSIKSLNINAKSSSKEETLFTVPKHTTFAVALMEITTNDNQIIIPLRTRNVTRIYGNGPQNLGHTHKKYFAPLFPQSHPSQDDEEDVVVVEDDA